MENLTTNLIASSSDFRRQQQAIVDQAKEKGQAVAILNHSRLTGYYVPAECVEINDNPVSLESGDLALAKALMGQHKEQLESLGKR